MSEFRLPAATSSQPGQPETRADRGLRPAQVRKRRCGALSAAAIVTMKILFLFSCVISCCRYELYVKMVSQELVQLEEEQREEPGAGEAADVPDMGERSARRKGSDQTY